MPESTQHWYDKWLPLAIVALTLFLILEIKQCQTRILPPAPGTTDTIITRDTTWRTDTLYLTPDPIVIYAPVPTPDTVYAQTDSSKHTKCDSIRVYTTSVDDSILVATIRSTVTGTLDSTRITYQLKPITFQFPEVTITKDIHHYPGGWYATADVDIITPQYLFGLAYIRQKVYFSAKYNATFQGVQLGIGYKLF
jgi:hypothetical protein